jgi:septal ring factor EnvC (AmiA/AmiB activator)
VTQDQSRDALAGWRDKAFADWLVVSIGLAAQTQPEALRAALASVFDLKAVEERSKIMQCQLNNLAVTAAEYRELFAQLARDLDLLSERWNALSEAIERSERDNRATRQTRP